MWRFILQFKTISNQCYDVAFEGRYFMGLDMLPKIAWWVLHVSFTSISCFLADLTYYLEAILLPKSKYEITNGELYTAVIVSWRRNLIDIFAPKSFGGNKQQVSFPALFMQIKGPKRGAHGTHKSMSAQEKR